MKTTQENTIKIKDLNALAIEAYNNDDYPEAREYLHNAIELDKEQNYKLFFNIAVVYKDEGDFELALEMLKRALDLAEENNNEESSNILNTYISLCYTSSQYDILRQNYLESMSNDEIDEYVDKYINANYSLYTLDSNNKSNNENIENTIKPIENMSEEEMIAEAINQSLGHDPSLKYNQEILNKYGEDQFQISIHSDTNTNFTKNNITNAVDSYSSDKNLKKELELSLFDKPLEEHEMLLQHAEEDILISESNETDNINNIDDKGFLVKLVDLHAVYETDKLNIEIDYEIEENLTIEYLDNEVLNKSLFESLIQQNNDGNTILHAIFDDITEYGTRISKNFFLWYIGNKEKIHSYIKERLYKIKNSHNEDIFDIALCRNDNMDLMKFCIKNLFLSENTKMLSYLFNKDDIKPYIEIINESHDIIMDCVELNKIKSIKWCIKNGNKITKETGHDIFQQPEKVLMQTAKSGNLFILDALMKYENSVRKFFKSEKWLHITNDNYHFHILQWYNKNKALIDCDYWYDTTKLDLVEKIDNLVSKNQKVNIKDVNKKDMFSLKSNIIDLYYESGNTWKLFINFMNKYNEFSKQEDTNDKYYINWIKFLVFHVICKSICLTEKGINKFYLSKFSIAQNILEYLPLEDDLLDEIFKGNKNFLPIKNDSIDIDIIPDQNDNIGSDNQILGINNISEMNTQSLEHNDDLS